MSHILCLSAILVLLIVGSSALLSPQAVSPGEAVLPTPWKPWVVRQNASRVCILAKFGAEFIIDRTSEMSGGYNAEPYVVNPLNAQVSNESHCGDELQLLRLVFNQTLSLSFTFKRNSSLNSIFVSQIVFNISDDQSVVYPTDGKKMFETPFDFSYKCFKPQTIPLNDRINMTLMNVRLEAFKSGNFNDTEDNSEQWERIGLKCKLDRVPGDAWKITGISLGCGIFVLAFITLVAIWSGRKQEKVMLKVKLMRQWTLEEVKAWEARTMDVTKAKTDNKSGPKQSEINNSVNSISNPSYGDSQSERY